MTWKKLLPAFGLACPMVALAPAAHAAELCDRIEWPEPPTSARDSCVTELETRLRKPGSQDFQAAVSCVWGEAEKRRERMAQLAARNGCLAEALMQFEDRLARAQPLQDVLLQAYDHYLINTPGAVADDEEFDPLERARAYARRLLQVEPERAILEQWRPSSERSGLLGGFLGRDPTPPCSGSASACELRAIGQRINEARYGRIDVIPSTLFPFRSEANGYDAHNAMWLADMAELVYHDWTCRDDAELQRDDPRRWICVRDQLDAWGYKPLNAWGYKEPRLDPTGEDAGEEEDTQAFLAIKADHAVIAFRGTSSLGDLGTNLKGWLTGYPDGGKVHHGFARALGAVWPELKVAVEALPENLRIFVTGHSLGGALAQLAAYRIDSMPGREVAAVYGFGSPRVGDRRFAGLYGKRLGDRTFLHVNGDDPVARVPTWPFYRASRSHVGRFDGEGHGFKLGIPRDEPREDPPSLLEAAMEAIRQATGYLHQPPGLEDPLSYAPPTEFERSYRGYHRASQYLFKLACLNTEERYRRLGGGT